MSLCSSSAFYRGLILFCHLCNKVKHSYPMVRFNIKKTPTYIIIGLPFLVLLVWFYVKVFQFQYLGEYFLDGLITLQLSRGWLEGRPILFDTYTGYHLLQHNYYFILITGFITKFTGVYGLFLVYLGLLGLFLSKWFLWLRQQRSVNWQREWIVLAVLAVGPFAYRIFMDYLGWHPEQYFTPLLGLLALSLATRKWYWSLFWGILILCIKETAPVLICSLVLFMLVVSDFLKDTHKPWYAYYLNGRTIGAIIFFFVLFSLSLVWLSFLNANQPSRLHRIFENVIQNATFTQWAFYTIILGTLSIIALGLCCFSYFPWVKTMPRSGIIIGTLAGLGLLLCFMFYIEGLYYFPVISPGIIYPPRISGLWALMMACYVFLVVRASEKGIRPHARQSEWTVWGLVLQFVLGPILVSNSNLYSQDILDGKKNLTFITEYKAGLRPYSRNPEKRLYTLAQKLPVGAEVICEKQYLNIFQRVYPTSWSWNVRRPFVGRPLLYVYDKKLLHHKPNNYIFPKTGYTTIPDSDLLILADTTWYHQHYK